MTKKEAEQSIKNLEKAQRLIENFIIKDLFPQYIRANAFSINTIANKIEEACEGLPNSVYGDVKEKMKEIQYINKDEEATNKVITIKQKLKLVGIHLKSTTQAVKERLQQANEPSI